MVFRYSDSGPLEYNNRLTAAKTAPRQRCNAHTVRGCIFPLCISGPSRVQTPDISISLHQQNALPRVLHPARKNQHLRPNVRKKIGHQGLTYFQPTIFWQQLQYMSATVCIPVVIILSSCGPTDTLTLRKQNSEVRSLVVSSERVVSHAYGAVCKEHPHIPLREYHDCEQHSLALRLIAETNLLLFTWLLRT